MTDKQTDEPIERYTEAPFSSSFYMFHSNGLKVLLTVRDSKVQRGGLEGVETGNAEFTACLSSSKVGVMIYPSPPNVPSKPLRPLPCHAF